MSSTLGIGNLYHFLRGEGILQSSAAGRPDENHTSMHDCKRFCAERSSRGGLKRTHLMYSQTQERIKMRCLLRSLLLLTLACALLFGVVQAAESKPLQIFFIDVEGGQATLMVTPSGQSLLIDTGWPGFNGRDASRIVTTAKAAGIERIDYVVITHFHRDHVGGVTQLADQIKIGTFVDHGPNMEDSAASREDFAAYEKVAANSKRLSVKPGDQIPMKDINVQVLTATGEHITAPLPGAGQPNPLCASEPEAPIDSTENARSLGMLITFGKFRFLDLGDLTKRKEKDLVCPNNLIGTVDLYLTTHHGVNQSNAKVIVDAIHPRVSIMNNGAHKGGSQEAWETIHNSPGLQDLWQLHYAMGSDKAHNVPEMFIANLDEKCEGKYIKVTAEANGTFAVLNSRNNFEKTYSK
jgi:competence protein ComEC